MIAVSDPVGLGLHFTEQDTVHRVPDSVPLEREHAYLRLVFVSRHVSSPCRPLTLFSIQLQPVPLVFRLPFVPSSTDHLRVTCSWRSDHRVKPT